MNTPIPPHITVTVCPPGSAEGIPPVVVGSTGRKGAPECLYREPISIGRGKHVVAPDAKKIEANKRRKLRRRLKKEN